MIVLTHHRFLISIPVRREEICLHWDTYELDAEGNLVCDQNRLDTFEYSDIYLETPSFQYVFRKVHYGSYVARQIIDLLHEPIYPDEITRIDLDTLPPCPGFHMRGELEIKRFP